MPAQFVTSADAVDREATWLRQPGNADDQLPTLLADFGGPWTVIQAYMPRTPAARKAGQIYVTRSDMAIERYANARTMFGYDFALRLIWPLADPRGVAENDQRAFDAAVHLLVMRIRGSGWNSPRGMDKTHNGAFLQVAEGSDVTHTTSGIHVHWEDPLQTMSETVDFRATVLYTADDPDFTD